MNILRFAAGSFLSLTLALAAAESRAQYQSGDSSSPEQVENADSNAAARLQVKITELEEQMRKLQGTVEQVSFENKQIKSQLEKSTADIEFRLNALEKKQDPAQTASETPPPESGKLRPVEQPAGNSASGSEDVNTASVPKFPTSREHYNYAFKLLNQAKYPESGAAFAAFTKTYPKDPLIGNAWYWLGETYYVRRDYVKAADDFRQGYEAMPTGPKAADNLLKLAMSENAIKKDKEACIILKQIVVKFGNSGSMKLRAEQEMNTIGCN